MKTPSPYTLASRFLLIRYKYIYIEEQKALLTWDGVHSSFLQLWEIFQVKSQGIVCGDALKLELVDISLPEKKIGLRYAVGLMVHPGHVY